MIPTPRFSSTRMFSFLGAASFLVLALPVLAAGGAEDTKKPQATAQSPMPTASAASPRELTAQDVEAFLDGLMPTQIEREDIAGAVVAVVKDGQVLFLKGYGFADVAKRKPVSS